MGNNERIAKNTLYLYFRTGFTMLVSLYTSRIVLNALRIEDLSVPFNSVIIAYERMHVYAYMAIVDVILKLLIAYVIYIVPSHKLLWYACMMLMVSGALLFFYYGYIRLHFVSCDIDSIKALNEKFITALLPFTCMEKTANAHSVTYHVRKMLDDKTVRLERKSNEERIRQDHFFRQGGRNFQTADIIIQVQLTTDNEDFIRQILLFAETNGKLSVTVN